MKTLVFLESATADLDSIYTFIAKNSGDTTPALRFIEEIDSKCRALASLPFPMGRPRPDIRYDLRGYTHISYIILFRYVDDNFEVVNVLHGSRDLESYYDEDA